MVSDGSNLGGQGLSEGPVSYTNVTVGDEQLLPCVEHGLYLVSEGDRRLAVLLRIEGRGALVGQGNIRVEVMAPNRMVADEFLKEIRTAMRNESIYRGRILSLEFDIYLNLHLNFHRLRKVERDSIILPAGLLERIEKGSVHFGANSKQLLEWKRHLRRGLLLYGQPGTGKTMTAMYLAGAMPGRSVMLVTGRAFGTLNKICRMARALQPSMVIIEDVDLIAEDRNSGNAGMFGGNLLVELMNEMDGMAEDTDTLFLLTTNRPKVLEPALAARPGRVDSAYELPLPDAPCRSRLFQLYSVGLPLAIDNFAPFVARTDGASPAFIKELMRTSASYAADENSDQVQPKHLDDAIREMVVNSGSFARTIFGFQQSEPSP
jgi:hypothetical protein